MTSAEFAYSYARVESLKRTPFEADLGWNPKSPLELLGTKSEDTVQTVNKFRDMLRE